MSDDVAVDPTTDEPDPTPEVGSAPVAAPPLGTEPVTSRGNGRGKKGKGDESIGSFLRELPVLLLIAFGLAFLLRMFVLQVFYIPSGSMIPTLQIDDRIVVEKVSYYFREPARGEIIVFAGETNGPTADETGVQRAIRVGGQFLGVVPMDARDFVKRVIGLPGDHIEMADGVVTVNGVELDEPYINRDTWDGEYDVPAGKLFVLGDNRGSSSDSRYALSYIDGSEVVGRAVLIIWPFENSGLPARANYAEIPDSPPSSLAPLTTATTTTPWRLPA